MAEIINNPVADPQLTDVFNGSKADTFKSFNCVKVGQIQSFNTTKKTAEVQILFKRLLADGTVKSFPILVDCPVFTYQGGGASIQMPITVGDQCILLFSDRSLDSWFPTGSESLPPDSRAHDLSDGIVLVGLNSLVSTLPSYSNTEASFKYLGAKIAESNGLITLQNQTTSLLTLLNGLIDVIASVTDANNVPLSAASIAALQAYKLNLMLLLY